MTRRLFLRVGIPCVIAGMAILRFIFRLFPFLGRMDGACLHGAMAGAPENSFPMESYFPDPVHKFVWRNWDLVPLERMAKVLKADTPAVERIGTSMGLARRKDPPRRYERRNQLAIIRRNWDYLPNKQLCLLLGMTNEQLKSFFMEETAFWAMVAPKPECRELLFSALREADPKTDFMKRTLESNFNIKGNEPREERFAFTEEFLNTRYEVKRRRDARAKQDEHDLASGWSMVLPESVGPVLETAARDFAQFMSEAMGSEVRIVYKGDSRVVAIHIGGMEPGCFSIRADEEGIRVTAGDEAAAMRAVFSLEELMELRGGPFVPRTLDLERKPALSPRIILPHLVVYGDLLTDPDFESYFPDAYLSRISHLGINGVWLPGILRNLVPSSVFPEFGQGSAGRREKLNWLVRKAGRYGIGVYLYLNEPRGMPGEFFKKYPDVKGEPGRNKDGLFSMCTSTESVQRYLVESTRRLFELTPDLAGLILITASENTTSCYSHQRTVSCPRCRLRPPYEVVAEVVKLIAQGAKQAKPSAEVIAWDWSWGIVEDDPQEHLIKALPRDVSFMVDFERGAKIKRGGVEVVVEEYCLSEVGPSPRALTHLKLAKESGLKLIAKIQLGNTWECGTVPFIPVLSLLGRKFQAMLGSGIQGALETFTSGSYPSINVELAQSFYSRPQSELGAAMLRVATRHYGEKAAPVVVEAFQMLSDAFAKYPFSQSIVYSSVVQMGPAHPLYFHPTGKRPGLFNSRDDLGWTGPYGPEIAATLFEEVAFGWNEGVRRWELALKLVPPDKLAEAKRDLGVTRALGLYFGSIAGQIRFVLCRRELGEAKTPSETHVVLQKLKTIVTEEMRRAREMYQIVQADSRIGYDPHLQYFYRPHDLLEKVVCCQDILDHQIPAVERRTGNSVVGARSGE